jgi:hypothetical protein
MFSAPRLGAVRTPVLAAALLVAGPTSGLPLVRLQPESVAAWTAYASATEHRIALELKSPSATRFLASDFGPDAALDRRATLSGDIVVRGVEARDARGRAIEVPSAMVHHWRGAILLPRVTLAAVMQRLQHEAPSTRQEDVLQSAVLARGPDWMKIALKLQRQKIVTVVYNTEHVVTFRRHGPAFASSASTAIRIAEVAEPGTPAEHELPPGHDRGFLWRLNAYWRYQEVPDGVIAECESISLSRDIPAVFRYLVGPMIRSAAHESMARTLTALRDRLEARTPPASWPAQ